MFVIDDPFLALILRFVVDSENPDAPNDEFLKRQLKAMRRYLARFPAEEHTTRAIEWIGKHAARYRRDWERNSLASRTVYLRCADCPLADLGAAEQCEIHEQWLYLLHRYLAGEVNTRGYIEDCLALLRESKERHGHRLKAAAYKLPKTRDPKKKKMKKKKKDKDKQKDKNKNKKKRGLGSA